MCPVCSGSDQSDSEFLFGKGKGKRRNPNGMKGPLTCDNCGADDHLWRQCNASNAVEYKRKRFEQMAGKGGGCSHFSDLVGSAQSAAAASQLSLTSQLAGHADSHRLSGWFGYSSSSFSDHPVQLPSDQFVRSPSDPLVHFAHDQSRSSTTYNFSLFGVNDVEHYESASDSHGQNWSDQSIREDRQADQFIQNAVNEGSGSTNLFSTN